MDTVSLLRSQKVFDKVEPYYESWLGFAHCIMGLANNY